jgi:hypothetical protein
MSLRQWHSIMPSDALSPSALAEDLAPALELSWFFGKRHVLLAVEDCSPDSIARVEERIDQRGLISQYYVTLEEFTSCEQVAARFSRGAYLVVVIDREPSAAAVERMITTRLDMGRLAYVVIGRKDWRFRDTFRSLPHFIRSHLFLDFPASIHRSDSFYSPSELVPIIDELKASSGFTAPPSFDPHVRLRKELLRVNVIAVSGPTSISDQVPDVSVVASDPDTLGWLAAWDRFSELGKKVELVVPRVIGQESEPLNFVGAEVSHLWLHLSDSAGHPLEVEAHLRNWGARYARGKFLIFADGASPEALAKILGDLLMPEATAVELLRLGLGIVVEADRFREVGGYDPLYFLFRFGEPEFLYRYLGGISHDGLDAKLAEFLKGKTLGPHGNIGAGLFFHQYFDYALFQFFSSASSAAIGAGNDAGLPLRSRFRYRIEQSRDAYLGIYKASPRVALDGHIQILLKPYHWIKPYAWLLKMPVYPLVVQPYHRIKLHAWLLKMPVYPLVVQPYHFLRQNAWRLKFVYYFIKVFLWRLWGLCLFFRGKLLWCRGQLMRLHGQLMRLKGQLWRIKQVYYFLFWLFFPIRKIYYFSAYQFEKRVLGLYDRPETLVKK